MARRPFGYPITWTPCPSRSLSPLPCILRLHLFPSVRRMLCIWKGGRGGGYTQLLARTMGYRTPPVQIPSFRPGPPKTEEKQPSFFHHSLHHSFIPQHTFGSAVIPFFSAGWWTPRSSSHTKLHHQTSSRPITQHGSSTRGTGTLPRLGDSERLQRAVGFPADSQRGRQGHTQDAMTRLTLPSPPASLGTATGFPRTRRSRPLWSTCTPFPTRSG